MERFYGFDLGDAESCVSRLENKGNDNPEILSIAGQKSFITAYAVPADGGLKIGENACYEEGAAARKLRFKSRFLSDERVDRDVRRFSAGVLEELYADGNLAKTDDACFYIGCPAGWNKNDRERYRAIFEGVGYPPLKIVSESRAALVCACQSRHLQVGYDIMSKPVLVVDIGSSTTDFAYVCEGKEMDIQTAGEVALGGGIMDELLLEACIADSPAAPKIRKVFEESEPWRSYCEFAARRLKEKYYSEEDYWELHPCSETLLIRYDKPLKLTLTMDEARARALVEQKTDKLGGRSFRQVFEASLQGVQCSIMGKQPELIFLTGGVSKLPAIRHWCEAIFPDAVIVCGTEPEYAVAKGLAWCGRIDQEMKSFRTELDDLIKSDTVENIVRSEISQLYKLAVDSLVEPIIEEAAVPVYKRWKSGEIRLLSDVDKEMQEAIEAYLHSDAARELLVAPITQWLRPISDKLEEYTVPICIKHRVPYSAMSLKSFLSASDIEIQLDAKSVFAIEEITWLIDSLISVIVGLLCGGNGIALVAGGIPGVFVGFIASFVVLALGKKQMEKLALSVNVPGPVRALMPKNPFALRREAVIAKVKGSLHETLENEKGEIITSRMVDEISDQIEACLSKMAEVVEIPLTDR